MSPRASKRSELAEAGLLDLPSEMLIVVMSMCDAPDLLSLQAVCRSLRDLQRAHDKALWGKIVVSRWDSDLLLDAVALAGSFRAFALQKEASCRPGADVGGWRGPCEYELAAIMQRIVSSTAAPARDGSSGSNLGSPLSRASSDGSSNTGVGTSSSSSSSNSELAGTVSGELASTSSDSGGGNEAAGAGGGDCAASGGGGGEVQHSQVMFLLDGSGSVGDEEFAASTSFIARVSTAAKTRASQPCKVSVLQFSNDVRTEWEDATNGSGQHDDVTAFENTIKSLVRLNGGTNISAALTHAGKLLKKSGADVAKVIVLITDGRVDGYQAKEARQVAARLADEQPTTTLFAFGVGRGVDRDELLGICGAGAPTGKYQAAEARYLDLFWKDEAHW